jgi:hypothetical protein
MNIIAATFTVIVNCLRVELSETGGGGGPLPGRPLGVKDDDTELFEDPTELCELLSEPLRVKLLTDVGGI